MLTRMFFGTCAARTQPRDGAFVVFTFGLIGFQVRPPGRSRKTSNGAPARWLCRPQGAGRAGRPPEQRDARLPHHGFADARRRDDCERLCH